MHISTISRALKRNSKRLTYNANYALILSKERKRESYKHHVFDANMERHINNQLMNDQWSPEQIKGCCDLKDIPMVSVARIYQYICKEQANGGRLYLHLALRWRKKRLNRKHH